MRYRVRVRFTVWRMMAAVACLGLVLGLVHEAVYDDGRTDGIPLAAWAWLLVFGVCLLAAVIGIALRIVDFTQFVRRSVRGRH